MKRQSGQYLYCPKTNMVTQLISYLEEQQLYVITRPYDTLSSVTIKLPSKAEKLEDIIKFLNANNNLLTVDDPTFYSRMRRIDSDNPGASPYLERACLFDDWYVTEDIPYVTWRKFQKQWNARETVLITKSVMRKRSPDYSIMIGIIELMKRGLHNKFNSNRINSENHRSLSAESEELQEIADSILSAERCEEILQRGTYRPL